MLVAETYVTFRGSLYNAYTLQLHTQVMLSKSRSETIYNAYDPFSNTTRLSSSLFDSGKMHTFF